MVRIVVQKEGESKGRSKSPKGSVVIQVHRERLRLCWTYQRKRTYLYLRLADTPANRKISQGVALAIEIDLASGNYDATLEKYRQRMGIEPGGEGDDKSSVNYSVSLHEMLESYIEYKRRFVDTRTLVKYHALGVRLQKCGVGGVLVSKVDLTTAVTFRDYLLGEMAPATAKEWLGILKAAWEWKGREERRSDFNPTNPWVEVCQLKVPPHKKPQPFTASEVRRILYHLKQYHPHYYPFVFFLFATGCRIGEAVGLQWYHLDDEFTSVWIGESVSRGRRSSTKTNKAREFKLSPPLVEMLELHHQREVEKGWGREKDLVFPSSQGNPIDDHNFRNRIWKPTLEALGISYRKPYYTRSTFESHALHEGIKPTVVAEITGHDPKVLFERYLGSITEEVMIPSLYAQTKSPYHSHSPRAQE